MGFSHPDSQSVVTDVAILRDGNIRKREQEKLGKMCDVKETVVLVLIGALGGVQPKLGKWLQQIPETSRISVQKSSSFVVHSNLKCHFASIGYQLHLMV